MIFEKSKILLENYFGKFKKEQLSTLNEMKFVCMLREIAWALMHEGLKGEKINHNMNYYKFANEVLDKLEQGIITL